MQTTPREALLDVPGARLRHFVRGSGPLLLLISGGHGDASAHDALATHLADRYTVLTYDRRGLSGSATDAPARTLATHADDASRLLATLTAEPAYVYGSSVAGLIALELTLRHPEQVGVVVAHEPAAVGLLPEPERAAAHADLRGAEEIFAAQGAGPAIRHFARFAGIDPEDREPDVALRATGPQQVRNQEFLLRHDVPAIRAHRLDVAGLRKSPARIVPAAGENSGHVWPNRCGRRLAEELGLPCEIFPGGHNGYVFRPRATAGRLHGLLTGQDVRDAGPA